MDPKKSHSLFLGGDSDSSSGEQEMDYSRLGSPMAVKAALKVHQASGKPLASVRARPLSPILRHSPERSLPDKFSRSSSPGPLPGKSRRVGFAEVTGVRPDAARPGTRGGTTPALPSQNESEGRGRAETPFTVAQMLLARNKSARERALSPFLLLGCRCRALSPYLLLGPPPEPRRRT